MNNIPALPPIDGDLLLDVLTRNPPRNNLTSHDSSEHGGAERLAELGHTVLNLSEKHKESMDDAHIKQWLTCYNLKSRVRGLDDRSRLDDPIEERLLFSSYVGAVYVQKGLPPLLAWISRLLGPDSEPLAAPGGNTTTVHPPPPPPPPPPYTAPAPPPAPPPPARASTSAGATPQVNALALFNQTCSQRGLVISWETESEGPPHQPRWAVRCLVNNQLKGTGTGRNQKVAKEEAARQAFQTLGWGSFH